MKKSFVGAGIYMPVIAVAALAESVTFCPEDNGLDVVTLIQNEPEYMENAVCAGQPPEYNIEKFTNPTPGGEADPSKMSPVSGTYTYTASVSGLSAGRLTKEKGVHQGPSGKETYYNLPMNGVVEIMRNMGYTEEQYPFWIRDDGCKMLGEYIMIAANLELRPRGTIVDTSLGAGIVCDTGGFAAKNREQIDIAVNW